MTQHRKNGQTPSFTSCSKLSGMLCDTSDISPWSLQENVVNSAQSTASSIKIPTDIERDKQEMDKRAEQL